MFVRPKSIQRCDSVTIHSRRDTVVPLLSVDANNDQAYMSLIPTYTRTALAQNVVDDSNCEENGIYCPMRGDPSYKKYCCLGSGVYSCCNPYLG